MAHAIAIAASFRALAPEELLRRFIVIGCALALIRPF
jgi:hypothetical protein